MTSDGGLVLIRELDERLGFGSLIEQHLTDSRRGKNTQFAFAALLRQSLYSRLAGYEDVNDAERLSQDPTFRLIGSEKVRDRGAALTSPLQSFETGKAGDAAMSEKSLRDGTVPGEEWAARRVFETFLPQCDENPEQCVPK